MQKREKITEITEVGLSLFAEQMQFIKSVIQKNYKHLDIVKIHVWTDGEISICYNNGNFNGQPCTECFRITFKDFIEMQKKMKK